MKTLLILPLCSAPVTVLAAGLPPISAENLDVFQWLLGLCLLGLGFFLAYTLKRIDDTNRMQWQSLNDLTKILSELKGEHAVNHRRSS